MFLLPLSLKPFSLQSPISRMKEIRSFVADEPDGKVLVNAKQLSRLPTMSRHCTKSGSSTTILPTSSPWFSAFSLFLSFRDLSIIIAPSLGELESNSIPFLLLLLLLLLFLLPLSLPILCAL